MKRSLLSCAWLSCALWAPVGCIEESEVATDTGPVDLAAPRVGPWFDVRCQNETPELVLALNNAAACGDPAAEGLVLRLPDARAVAEGAELRFTRAQNTVATYTEAGQSVLILEGSVRFDRWYASGLGGSYRVLLVGGVVREGRFDVSPCADLTALSCMTWPAEPIPDQGPDAAPPPDLGPDAAPPADSGLDASPDAGPQPSRFCQGRYRITQWDIDELAFDPTFLNPLLANDLAAERLIWDTVFAGPPEQLRFENLQRANGQLQPHPEVPEGEAFALSVAAGNFTTPEPGRAWLTLGDPGYDNSGQEIGTLPLYQVTAQGRFEPDCSGWSGRVRGAFVDFGYSIPASPDTDTDGDGTRDGFMMGGLVEAVRVDP